MRTLAATFFTLSAQWLLGALFYSAVARLLRGARARRRWIAAWSASARALCRRRHLATACSFSAGTLALLAATWPEAADFPPWPHVSAFILLGAVSSAACHSLIDAGHRQLRGQFTAARHQGRLAGQLLALGASSQLAFVAAASDWTALTTPLHLAGAIALILAAFVALSAALAAKPHPSSYLATLLYIGGVVSIIVAVR